MYCQTPRTGPGQKPPTGRPGHALARGDFMAFVGRLSRPQPFYAQKHASIAPRSSSMRCTSVASGVDAPGHFSAAAPGEDNDNERPKKCILDSNLA